MSWEESVFLGFGFASALPKYNLTATERKALKARQPIGFVRFPSKTPSPRKKKVGNAR